MTLKSAVFFIALTAWSQNPAKEAPAKEAQAKETPPAKETPQAKEVPKEAAREPEKPVPAATESWLTGSVDVGYRWRTAVAGSFDTYRSFVNLGEGPKLLGADFTITDPKHRLFDQMTVRGNGWGGDPDSTIHVNARKAKWYDLRANYRNIAYFNFLPSYADPLLARGVVLNEQSFDTRRRMASFELDLVPEKWIRPYFAFERNTGSGTGVTAFVSDGNEYAVPNVLRDATNLFRGGVRLEFRRGHITLEEGGTTFKDDQNLYQANRTNFGNNLNPVFGRRLDLTGLIAAYGVRGTSTYSKALATASPTSWLDIYGQFLYSQPQTDVNYSQAATGDLYLQSQVLFYGSQQYRLSSAAKLPHTSANLGVEIRPWKRLRIAEAWLTDRVHESGSANSTLQLTSTGLSQRIAAQLSSALVTNYNQQQTDVFFDLTRKITLRGGYRYVWGGSNTGILPPGGLVGFETGTLKRNTGLGAVTYRSGGKLTLTGEVEGGSSSGAYFRTSLYDYQKVRALARYQLSTAFQLSADFTALNNQNPAPGVRYDYLAMQQSISFGWSPVKGKLGDLRGSYTRSTIRSDLSYLSPSELTPLRSFYRENAHTASALWSTPFKRGSTTGAKISAGGSMFKSAGSRSTAYYQPVVKLWVPSRKNIGLFADWRYYGYGEAFYLYEGFRTHIFVAGLRLSR